MDDFNPNKPPAPIIATFYEEPVLMEFKSKEAGRPIYEPREFVRLIVPGNRGMVHNEPANDDNKARFAKEYAAFKAGQELAHEGTLLSQWPPMTRSQVEEFKHFHVFTVEHLAAVNDGQIQHMPMGTRELQRAAKVFLDAAKNGTGPLLKLVADNEAQKVELEALRKTVEELSAHVKVMEKTKNARAQ